MTPSNVQKLPVLMSVPPELLEDNAVRPTAILRMEMPDGESVLVEAELSGWDGGEEDDE